MENSAAIRQVQEQLTAFEERFQAWQHSYQDYQRSLTAFYQRQARIREWRRRSREHQQSKTVMKPEITASLVQGNGHVVAMPTDELLMALDHIKAGNSTQGQRVSSNKEAIYAFLQTLKAVMQDCKTLPAEP